MKGQLYRICRNFPSGVECGFFQHSYSEAMRVLDVDRKAAPGLEVWAEGEDGTRVNLLTPEQEVEGNRKVGALFASLGQPRSVVDEKFRDGYDAWMRKGGVW